MTFDDVSAVIVTRGDVDMSWTKDLPYGEVIVYDNSKYNDCQVYGRYYGATELATRPVVYFQDDDVRFHEHEALLDRYEPGVLVSNMYDQWIADCGYFDLALVGLGSIMDVGLWKDAFERYQTAYPHDDRFTLDCDFIFGTLARWKRIDFGHEILDIASDDTRLWKQPEQFEGKWRSIHRARSLREVVLTMLVKDEEQNIQRALNSAKGLFDRGYIIDTGSTDNTVELIWDWSDENGVPIKVDVRQFTNFGEMRNLLLEEGRKLGDYQLLMDADEEFVERPKSWPELEADAYVLHYDGPIDYGQPRLISSNFPWQFEGQVHACLGVNGTMTPRGVNLREPLIVHHGDERHGRERLERDVELLREQIDEGHDIPRSWFLLGKAYEGLGAYEHAIRAYEIRIGLTDSDEETYYSRFRLGVLTGEQLNDFPTAARHLLAAWEDRPTRVEALRALAFYATAIADATPYPEDDLVIVHRHLYRDRSQGDDNG
jgi:tetratricopeptide (TPR) repeat protein